MLYYYCLNINIHKDLYFNFFNKFKSCRLTLNLFKRPIMLESEKSILLVEDDTSTRLIIQKSLSKWGCKILSVASAEEAIRVVNMITPDLALIDISLPGIDGITLAEMLLKKNITAVVLMTADKSHATNTELKNHKVICKPFNSEELKEIVMQTSFIFD